MANTSNLFGLRPVKYLNGTPWNGAMNVYYASASDSAAIYKGDLVAESAAIANYEATGKYPTIKRAAAGDLAVGVAIAFSTVPEISADPTNLVRAYRPASTAMYVWVVDDPNVVFHIQESEVTADVAAPIVAADVGANGDIVAGGGSTGATAGNTSTGISYMCLDSTDVHAKALSAASAQLKVLRLANLPSGNALGAYAVWEVIINEHVFKTGSAGTTRS